MIDPFEPPPAALIDGAAAPFTLGIMEAGGVFSVMLDGPGADVAYDALKAQGFAWPLHATWKVRACAEDALKAVQAKLQGQTLPDLRAEALRVFAPYAVGHVAGTFVCRVCFGKSTTTYSKDIVHTPACPANLAR